MNMFTLQTLAAKAEQSGEDLGGFMSPERLETAGQVVLIGMGMVFAVLALLWGVLAIFGKVMTSGNKKKTADEQPAEAPAPVAAPAELPEEMPAGETGTAAEDDEELVAALTAAVAAAIASDEELSSRFASGFRVVSFKKAGR